MPPMKIDPLYTAVATATGDGRNGHVTSEDGFVDMDVRVPKELGGPGGATNPEQLFAAGYSACFIGAMKAVAGKMKVTLPQDLAIDAEVDLALDDGGFSLIARLNVSLPGIDRETAETLTARAHEICPYSKATRGNIAVDINIV